MSTVSGTLIEGQDRIEMVRPELSRARQDTDRVDTGLEIAEDILGNTEKVTDLQPGSVTCPLGATRFSLR